MSRLPKARKLKPVIGLDLDSTLVNDLTSVPYWGVVRYVMALKRKTKLPVVIVTARPMWFKGQVEFIKQVLADIYRTSRWMPDRVIAEFGLEEFSIPTYKVRMFRKYDLTPVVMIDDMPDVLVAIAREFKAMPILARDGKLEKLAA